MLNQITDLRTEALAAQLERRNRQLAIFSQSVMNIAGELSLDKVLQQIVESARELVSAKYAALGVPGLEGKMDTFIYDGLSPHQANAIPHLPTGSGLLGAIIREKRSIRLPDISIDPRTAGFPEGHPPMVTFLGVPIVAAGQVLGSLLSDRSNWRP